MIELAPQQLTRYPCFQFIECFMTEFWHEGALQMMRYQSILNGRCMISLLQKPFCEMHKSLTLTIMVSTNVRLTREWIQLIWIRKTLDISYQDIGLHQNLQIIFSKIRSLLQTLFLHEDLNKAINVLTVEGLTIFIFHCLSIKLDVKFLHAPIIIKTYLTNVVCMAKKQNPIIVVELSRENHTSKKKEIHNLKTILFINWLEKKSYIILWYVFCSFSITTFNKKCRVINISIQYYLNSILERNIPNVTIPSYIQSL